jgi:hypothetical protein
MVYISYVLFQSGEGVGVQTSPYLLEENGLKHISLDLLCVIFFRFYRVPASQNAAGAGAK